jgi:hypothetical protein
MSDLMGKHKNAEQSKEGLQAGNLAQHLGSIQEGVATVGIGASCVGVQDSMARLRNCKSISDFADVNAVLCRADKELHE